jgi:HupE / UreJ protein
LTQRNENALAHRGGRRAIPGLVLLLLSIALPAGAHELGTIQAYVTLQAGGTWKLDVAIDEEHVPKVRSDRPVGESRYGRIAGLTPALAARLGTFLSVLADGSTVAFDGRPAAPESVAVDLPPPPADDPFAPPPKVTLHMKGAIPPGARTVAFTTSVPVGNYPAAFVVEGDPLPPRKWQKGGVAGSAFPLPPRVVPPPLSRVALDAWGEGFRGILPRSAEAILVVLGIFLLTLRARPLLAQLATLAAAQILGLAVAAYGLLALPPRIAGPAAALSLLAVAVANLLARDLQPPRLALRLSLRLALIAACGLLQGMALAKAVRAPGAARALLSSTLLGFGLGVVTAEVVLLAALLALLGLSFRDRPWYRTRVVVPASLALATLGLYWSAAQILHP